MSDQEEIWKDIEGYDGKYQVSNLSRIKSFARDKKGIILNGSNNNNGYLTLKLDHKDYRVHRLIAMHFIPNPDNKPEINHKDGNKHNNLIENLEWVTREENLKHAEETGLNPRGENHPSYKGAILGFDKDGKHVITLKDRKDIREKGFGVENIRKCLVGDRKTHKGLRFERVIKLGYLG